MKANWKLIFRVMMRGGDGWDGFMNHEAIPVMPLVAKAIARELDAAERDRLRRIGRKGGRLRPRQSTADYFRELGKRGGRPHVVIPAPAGIHDAEAAHRPANGGRHGRQDGD